MQQPSVGRIVHYVSYGTPGGEYPSTCRVATITEVDEAGRVGLAVINPTGLLFHPIAHENGPCPYDSGGEQPGSPDCPNQQQHGEPFRYCSCGWREASLRGGTWHWPEREPEE